MQARKRHPSGGRSFFSTDQHPGAGGAPVGPSLVIERLEFQRDGVWYARYFKGLVTFLVGHSKSGKSTAIEVLLYPLGLTTATVMPEVRSCQYVRLVFRAFSVKSSVLRSVARRRAW
ncbi:hypothetical protein [Streptomyces malaysiensis]|uniref:hypothetical protein n=1 Tax=Streptomyces malaysiensis TaxID=92644 RepID=UPI0013969369|nr:hypothetical protein [Streptomyces malaysiensis]